MPHSCSTSKRLAALRVVSQQSKLWLGSSDRTSALAMRLLVPASAYEAIAHRHVRGAWRLHFYRRVELLDGGPKLDGRCSRADAQQRAGKQHSDETNPTVHHDRFLLPAGIAA